MKTRVHRRLPPPNLSSRHRLRHASSEYREQVPTLVEACSRPDRQSQNLRSDSESVMAFCLHLRR